MSRGIRIFAAFIAIFTATLSIASAESFTRDKTVWFSDLAIGSGDEVRGNLDVVFGNVTCGDGAQIDGDVRTFFGSFTPLDGCQVNGRVVHAFDGAFADGAIPWYGPLSNNDFFAQNRRFLRLLAWDVVVLFAFLLFPVRVRVALDRVEKHPGLSGAVGAVAMVAALPVGVLLMLSVIGIPLIPLEIALLFAGFWIGSAAVALVIGRRLYELLRPHATATPLGALGLGLVVMTAAESLHVVGWAVMALVALVGLGAAILAFVRETSFRSYAPSTPASQPPMKRSAAP